MAQASLYMQHHAAAPHHLTQKWSRHCSTTTTSRCCTHRLSVDCVPLPFSPSDLATSSSQCYGSNTITSAKIPTIIHTSSAATVAHSGLCGMLWPPTTCCHQTPSLPPPCHPPTLLAETPCMMRLLPGGRSLPRKGVITSTYTCSSLSGEPRCHAQYRLHTV